MSINLFTLADFADDTDLFCSICIMREGWNPYSQPTSKQKRPEIFRSFILLKIYFYLKSASVTPEFKVTFVVLMLTFCPPPSASINSGNLIPSTVI